MTDRDPSHATSGAPDGGRGGATALPTGRTWQQRFVLVLVAVIALALVLLFVVAFLPRWWAHRIANQVDGSYTSGIVWGLFAGAVFTAIPLVVGRFACRRHVPWRTRGILVAVALVLAAPNLLTLGIVLGNGDAARDARATLQNRGTGFRGATLIGAIVGAVLVAFAFYLLASRRSRRREIADLRGQLRAREQDPPAG